MKNNKCRFIISIIWLIITTFSYFFIRESLKFPITETVDDSIHLFLIFLVPVVLVVYFIFPEKYKRAISNGIFMLAFGVSIVYLIYSMSFSLFYPINVSETDDYKNYLSFDYVFEGCDAVEEVFPAEIPTVAKDVSYYYKASPVKSSMFVEGSWVLPENEFLLEKERISSMADKVLKYGETIYYYIPLSYGYCHVKYCHVKFDTEDKRVLYFADINYYCDWDSISWIRREFEMIE